MDSTTICPKCNLEIIPESWADAGWGKGPHCGLGICSCAFGLPVLKEGDIIVDRNYMAGRVYHTTYGYRGMNIMCVQRPRKVEAGQEILEVIWKRKE